LEITIHQPEALIALFPAMVQAFAGRRKVALYGDMGAGKTTFVKMFCRFLGVDEGVNSPTFSLVNEYQYREANGTVGFIHHLDLYRLETAEEVFDIGLDDLLEDPWYCLIEWPQLAEPFFSDDLVKIQIEIMNETERRILILNPI